MGVRAGYKQAAAGLIPGDWDSVCISNLAAFVNGKPHESDIDPLGAFALITLDSIGIDGNLKTEHRTVGRSDNSLTQNDIVIILSDIAHGKLLGLCDLIPEGDRYVLNQRVGRLRAKERVTPQFLRLQINARQDYFAMRGQGTSQRHIYRRDIDALAVPVPPLPEQCAIAETLEDVEALLGALTWLIVKKRDLKQAIMQGFLTGQMRLPGFSEAWGMKRLGDIVSVNMGQSPGSRHYNRTGHGIPLIQGNADIEARKSVRRVWTSQVTKECDEGDVLLTVRAPVGAVGLASERSCLGRGVCSLTPLAVVKEFLFDALVLAEGRWKTLEQGSTFTSANSTQVASFSIPLPPSKAEQIAVAAALSDMDAEIEALERGLAKTLDLKRGMMQELLSGRTRLV